MEAPDDVPRVKFLCSFGGTILPRPIDGKLRYVGGETRIVSVARDIGYVELMTRMKELFESASLLKYQQPDEDLDALVSVVNDDDVINMMEEYDKLEQSDGFTRLRMFLFSNGDDDSAIFDMDERESQRRYVDALNSLNDPSDNSRQTEMIGGQNESFHMAEQFFSCMHLDSMRNCEVMAPQYNGHQLGVLHPAPLIGHYNGPVVFQDHEMGYPGMPRIASPLSMAGGREVPSQVHTPRYNDTEMSWNPAYYSSSGHLPSHDPRLVSDFCPSPAAPQRHVGFDLHDRVFEEPSSNGHNIAGAYATLGRQGLVQAAYDQDNSLLMQQGIPVLGDSSRFQMNVNNQTPSEGNSKRENSHLAFMGNQTPLESHCTDARWRRAPAYVDHANEASKVCHCKECYYGKEATLMNPVAKENGAFQREQLEADHNLGDFYGHERGWIAHRTSHWPEEARGRLSGAQRLNERFVQLPYANSPRCHPLPLNHINQEDPQHVQAVSEFNGEDVHDNIRSASHLPVILPNDLGTKYGNFPDAIVKDDHSCPLGPAYSVQKTAAPVPHGTPPPESPGFPKLENGATNSVLLMAPPMGSPMLCGNNENAKVIQGTNPYTANPFDAFPVNHALGLNKNVVTEHNKSFLHLVGDEKPSVHTAGFPTEVAVDAGSVFATGQNPDNLTQNRTNLIQLHSMGTQPHQDLICFAENTDSRQSTLSSSLPKNNASGSPDSSNYHTTVHIDLDIPNEQSLLRKDTTSNELNRLNQVSAQAHLHGFNGNPPNCVLEDAVLSSTSRTANAIKSEPNDVSHESNKLELSDECLKFIPELMASVKKAKLEGIQQIHVQEIGDAHDTHEKENDRAGVPADTLGVHRLSVHDIEHDEDPNVDNPTTPKIEQTKAEEEALEKGLQTIKNSDLEEIRKLGSGTYGSVYHGKWRGSDVAIKRIKPSCFAGRPSERERLIADFWKEALMLSSLHHPNVVSFYGVVRDGPGGSLATVTEFMVNGSLKQVLHKKDRTIDRRKRLIIAMDASFGMEYLHAKKIVHFDLKCENLLVNMKDPHRPVCKIGDLGLSKVRQRTLVSGGVRGTLPWMAPELLSGKNNMVTEKIDVYSFGIVMWEVLTGEEPYADMHCATMIGGIVNNSLRPEIPAWCDPEWRSLMESCWSSDPGKRPSFVEISQTLRKMFSALNLK